mmetsp:Transcript_6996/g.8828  ORF Transcript_6996/g.8828 Transcript_6996/m.8828 type:complete len:98 (+) Transcript_6996:180-473(+)
MTCQSFVKRLLKDDRNMVLNNSRSHWLNSAAFSVLGVHPHLALGRDQNHAFLLLREWSEYLPVFNEIPELVLKLKTWLTGNSSAVPSCSRVILERRR